MARPEPHHLPHPLKGLRVNLLTIDEVAERLRVPVQTIRWLRQEGRFAPAYKVGRRLLWAPAEVDAWLAAQHESVAA